MKFLLSCIVAVAALVVAAPVDETLDAALKRRVDMVLCRREDFDDCTVFKDIDTDACINIPSELNDRIRSITFYHADQCTFYVEKDCNGKSITDAGNLPDLKKRFRDKLSSYNCQGKS